MNVIFVAGLPGSGKTTWCLDQVKAISNSILVDDPSVCADAWDQARRPGIAHVFVADPHLCTTTPAAALAWAARCLGCPEEDITPSWVCFENDPEACSVRARPNVQGMIAWMHQAYVYPEGATIMSIPRSSAEPTTALPMIPRSP